ncbi:MAG TPA: rod shape-determining protein MreC [Gammaproteobacteria bacterium]|nr:rod shape-determining protein MreC [Gammaproteobacteria bacterium]HCI87245.1 rod shape-determining protein MreC [Gammaproteobacteria bacterium]HCL71303.1 rod shape-determining protein MreC [Gammaproteobacteria bacterium]
MDKTLFIKGVALEYRALAFLLLSICIMFADGRFGYLERVRYGLGYVTTPVYWVADIPTRISFWIDDVFVSRSDLLVENERLREDLLVAQRELQLLESLASENSRLLDLREATQVIAGEVMPAEIINVSPDPYSKRILINKGSEDGVFLGQALLDAKGLMGQVDEVLPFSAWVLLITDSHHITPVEVNRNGERALARGSRSTVSELELEFVTQTQDMKAGDLLVSSGMGQVYPKNYPVAEVTSVYSDPGQDFTTVKARPLAQLASTRHVMLVFASEERVLPEFDLEPGEETLPEAQPVEPVFDESQVSQIDPSTSNQ